MNKSTASKWKIIRYIIFVSPLAKLKHTFSNVEREILTARAMNFCN